MNTSPKDNSLARDEPKDEETDEAKTSVSHATEVFVPVGVNVRVQQTCAE